MSTTRLDHVTTKIGSGATPRGGEKVYKTSGIALIRSQNVYNDGFHADGLAFIGDEHAAELSQVEVRSGDVLLNITGDSVARVCQVPDEVLPARVNQHVAIIRPRRDALDARFLHYFLISPLTQAHLHALASAGATRNALTKAMIQALEIPRFPLSAQEAIAQILGSLDDKVEVNLRMNETLEAIARATFKSWFIDFDPVRAKSEGRQPLGADAETAALFPSSFEDSPLGKIPKGWRVGKAQDLVTLGRDTITPCDFPDELFDHYSIPAFDEGRWPKVESGGEIKSNKFYVPGDAVLLSKLNPRIRRIWLPFIGEERRSIASTEFLVIRPKTQYTRDFLYFLFSSESFAEVFATLVTGTSGSHQRVKPEFLLSMHTVIPSKECVLAFIGTVKPMCVLIAKQLGQSQTLAALRDLLLPKLISGEIRVKDAEKLVAEKV
jgi:type I restriction enzyme S subunit